MIPEKMRNPNLGMRDIKDYKWGDKGIPTRENCNLDNPKEMFLWMFTALPGLNGAPLMLPPEYWMLVSEHLYELGARLGAEPVKKYRPPSSNEPHWATSPGQWVPVEEPDIAVDPAVAAWSKLSPIQKAEFRAIANAEHVGEPLPYSDVSPSRVMWSRLPQHIKDRLRELANEEHESEP